MEKRNGHKFKQALCDHSYGSGIVLIEVFKVGRNRLMFMCIHCKEGVTLPDIIWDNVRNPWQK